jgi:hypothetical protein
MKELEIEKAILSAKGSSQIDDIEPSKEELETIKSYLLADKKESSFLFQIVQMVKKEKEKKLTKDGGNNVKTRRRP